MRWSEVQSAHNIGETVPPESEPTSAKVETNTSSVPCGQPQSKENTLYAYKQLHIVEIKKSREFDADSHSSQ